MLDKNDFKVIVIDDEKELLNKSTEIKQDLGKPAKIDLTTEKALSCIENVSKLGIKERHVKKAIEKCQSTEFDVISNYIFDHPNEFQNTPEEIEAELNAAKKKAQ